MRRAPLLLAGLLLGFLFPPATLAHTPEQLHVSLTGDGTGLTVAWVTRVAYFGAYNPVVEWRADGGALRTTRALLIGAPPPEYPGIQTYVYGATLEQVPYEATVTYRVGEPTLGWSAQRTTRMVPPPGTELTLVAYGDLGTASAGAAGQAAQGSPPPVLQVRDLALRLNPDLVLWLGDLAYADGNSGWDTFFTAQEPLMSKVPVMPVIGNHDWQLEPREHARDHYEARFMLPRDESNYGFRAGPAYFIGINSELPCSLYTEEDYDYTELPCTRGRPNRALHAWLESELQAAQASDATWIIPFFHKPAYSWGRHGPDRMVQTFWVPLFEKHKVDVVLQGHDHLYSRSHPILRGQPTTTANEWTQGAGVAYAVHGGGGRDLYDLRANPPDWYAFGAKTYGLMRLKLNQTTLVLEGLNEAGTVLDSFTIRAQAPQAADPSPGPTSVPAWGWIPVLAVIAGVAWIRRRPLG